jgi:hypothetical protein
MRGRHPFPLLASIQERSAIDLGQNSLSRNISSASDLGLWLPCGLSPLQHCAAGFPAVAHREIAVAPWPNFPMNLRPSLRSASLMRRSRPTGRKSAAAPYLLHRGMKSKQDYSSSDAEEAIESGARAALRRRQGGRLEAAHPCNFFGLHGNAQMRLDSRRKLRASARFRQRSKMHAG